MLNGSGSGARFFVYSAAAVVWAAFLYFFCVFQIVEKPPTPGSFVALLLAVLFLGLAHAAFATLLWRGVEPFVLAARWPRLFDLLQSVVLGLASGWFVLSLVKYRATRAQMRLDDLRFILSSLAQVSAEASAAERRLLWLAVALPLLVAATAYAGLRAARRRPAVSLGQVGFLAATAIAGLLTLAWRQPYARFVLATVAPETSAIARLLGGASTMGGAPERTFVPDPARHRPIVPYEAPPEFRRANVVVLMLESIPWSRLFGPLARPESTPRLAALAAQSTRFDRAYATATHSDYAQTSILASLHPRKYQRHEYFTELAYPRTLIWDLFRPLGYRTALFSCQNEGWGNMQAFLRTPGLDLFRHSPDWPEAPRRGEGAESKVFEETPVNAFLAWVESAPRKPFVAYLNFQATHYPYLVPTGEPEPYQPSALDFETTFLSYPSEKIPVMENRFYNALAYVDRQTGRLVDGLAAAGAWENTILLVVSDHGEAFYEHGIPTHGTMLHEEQLRTAMFLRLPGASPRIVDEPVSVLDAVPAIVRSLGLPEHGNFQGRSDVLDAGYSARGRRLPFTIQGMTREDGLLEGRFKYIVNWDRGERALFDLELDPEERQNRFAADSRQAEALDRALTGLLLDQLAYYRERGWEQGYYPSRLP